MQQKHKLSIDKQIEYMQNAGVKFDIINKEQAKVFLTESNYFFKIKVFAKNYDKDSKYKYLRLDFAYLREISIIDTLLRDLLLELCLACEHLLKTQINTHCSNDISQDGYSIVEEFLNRSRKPSAFQRYEQYLQKSEHDAKNHINVYEKKLMQKHYTSSFPLWAFLEVLSFSELNYFYDFYCQKTNLKQYSFVQEVRRLRNVCAHNVCILNHLKDYRSLEFEPQRLLQCKIRALKVFSKNVKLKYLKNPLIHDCLCLMFLVKELCPQNEKMLNKIKKKLFAFIRRARKKPEYFIHNDHIKQSFIFTIKLILKIFK